MDVVVLRDVIERHAVSNPLALRWIKRQLLANPGGPFSIKKHYDTLRSQGMAVGKDTLHAYLAHLEDAFLIRSVAMHAASERQRMVNPRKAYPVDTALIPLFERTGRTHHGRALETAVMLELERRGWEVAYLRTPEGFEVDFLAQRPGEPPLLVQVSLESEGDETWDRELRALERATHLHSETRAFVVTLDAVPPTRPLPRGLTWAPAARRTGAGHHAPERVARELVPDRTAQRRLVVRETTDRREVNPLGRIAEGKKQKALSGLPGGAFCKCARPPLADHILAPPDHLRAARAEPKERPRPRRDLVALARMRAFAHLK